MSDPAPAVPVPKAAPVPAVSLAAALQMEGFWANARLQSMALEKQMLEMNKDRVKRAMDVMADLGKTRDEVGQHQDQFRCQTAKNEEIRKDIESLRGQKAILEKSTCSTRQISDTSPEMVLSLDCPCFRVLTRTIDGGAADSGYLSMVKGTVLVAVASKKNFSTATSCIDPATAAGFPSRSPATCAR